MEEKMEAFERLRQIREERGYDVKTVAEILGVRERQILRWERGENRMKFSKYVELARFYGLSLDYIVGLIDEPMSLE